MSTSVSIPLPSGVEECRISSWSFPVGTIVKANQVLLFVCCFCVWFFFPNISRSFFLLVGCVYVREMWVDLLFPYFSVTHTHTHSLSLSPFSFFFLFADHCKPCRQTRRRAERGDDDGPISFSGHFADDCPRRHRRSRSVSAFLLFSNPKNNQQSQQNIELSFSSPFTPSLLSPLVSLLLLLLSAASFSYQCQAQVPVSSALSVLLSFLCRSSSPLLWSLKWHDESEQ